MKIIILFFTFFNFLFGETLKPLTVLIDFPDYKYYDLQHKESELINNHLGEEFTPELYEKMFFGQDGYIGHNGEKFISAKKYFELESSNSFILKGDKDDIYGWFTAPKSSEYYGKNISKDGDSVRASHLVEFSIDELIKAKVDFSQYDLNDDGIIDCLSIVYSGKGEEIHNSLGSKAIWPHFNRFQNISKDRYYYFKDHNNKSWKIDRYFLVPQDLPLDLYIHEIGHYLGLEDLYKGESNIGYWSIMGHIYCGEIVGSMPNSMGAYHRYNLHKRGATKGGSNSWANVKEYDLESLKNNSSIKLFSNNDKTSNNIVKINLPGKKIDIPIENRVLFYTDNHLGSDNNIQFSVFLPKHQDNILEFDTWFNSEPHLDLAKVYIRNQGEEKWHLLKNLNHEKSRAGKWITLKYNLRHFNGKRIEVMINLIPYTKEGTKGAYISNLTMNFGSNKHIDLKDNKDKFQYNDFDHTLTDKILERYLLIEYRDLENKDIDKGLHHTRLKIPYSKGLLIWHVDEGYSDFNQLVNIIPSNKKPLYEIINGELVELDLKKYITSSWSFSTNKNPEMAIKNNNRFFYREPILGTSKFFLLEKLKIEILEENKSDIEFSINYKE